MRSLCQADFGQEEGESDDGDEDKAGGDTEKEGDTEEGGGGRGAQPPSARMPIDTFFEPQGPDDLAVWGPKPHAKSIAFMAALLLEREAHMERNGRPQEQGGFEVIEPFYVHDMFRRLKEKFEQTPRQQGKTHKDRSNKNLNSTERAKRKKGRFNSMLDQGCGVPREDGGDASSAPPPAGENNRGKKRSAPNKGGRKVAEFILAVGTSENDYLQSFQTCLDEGAEDRRKEDEEGGWSWKRRKGDTQSWGMWEVRRAQKKRRLQRCATNNYRRFKLEGWDTGAPGTISIVGADGSLRPLSDFPGRCRGEVHGDRICGEETEDLKKCLLCYEYEKVERWLCAWCRRTDVGWRRTDDAGICRICPAVQRRQGGRQPRKDELPACEPEELEKKKDMIRNYYGSLMTQKSFQKVDEATWRAGLGKKFSGGTAREAAGPFPGQARMATTKTMELKAQAAETAAPGSWPGSASGGGWSA